MTFFSQKQHIKYTKLQNKISLTFYSKGTSLLNSFISWQNRQDSQIWLRIKINKCCRNELKMINYACKDYTPLSCFCLYQMQFNPGATFNEYFRSKHLIHTFQLKNKEASSLWILQKSAWRQMSSSILQHRHKISAYIPQNVFHVLV